MDDDVLRRGRPTCHVEYDEATALLVGDSLQSLAFQVLSDQPLADDPRVQLDMIRRLAVASGSRGMAGGQAIDLSSVDRTLSVPELEVMHIHKTGALIRAAVLLGASCGSGIEPSELARLDAFAKQAGLAFQVVDDVLDASASTAVLGKTAGKDAKDNKPTYVSIMGTTAAAAFARDLQRGALESLSPLGSRAARLGQVVAYIVERSY